MVHAFEAALSAAWPVSQWQDVTVLVAVSGGPDSIALLRGLRGLEAVGQGQLAVGHYNHQWRSSAGEDADFVRDLAAQWQLPFCYGEAESGAARNEETARRQRYDFLLGQARKIGARFVAMAHTSDDQVETIIHRIMRGTSLSGLAGIPRVRLLDHGVVLIRPLLHSSRQEVESYLESLGQPWREDETNDDVSFTRNRIRHDLLPLLQEQFNAEVNQAVLRLGTRAAELQEWLGELAAELMRQHVVFRETDKVSRVQVHCAPLAHCQDFLLQELFVAIWRQQQWPRQSMGASQWQRLACLVRDPILSASESLPGAVQAKKEGESVWLTRPQGDHLS